MSAGISYPLNPVDYVLLGTHQSLRQRGYCGLSVILFVDLEGPLDPSALAEAVHRLGRVFPVLSARIHYSPIARRASWHIAPDANLAEAVEFRHVSLRPDQDPWEPFVATLNDPVDLSAGPQVRVVHADLGGSKHRIAIRWAHPLMDMEGGHLLLKALDELLQGRTPTPHGDPRVVIPPPYGGGWNAVRRAWQGRALYAYYDAIHQPRIVKRPEGLTQTCRLALRHYDRRSREDFETMARRRISPGPMRYTRAALVALARTYLQMATERGRPRPRYLFPQTFTIPRAGPRPTLHGNYVVVAWIVFHASDLADWASADAVAAQQLSDFQRKHRDAAAWHMYRSAAKWPILSQWIMSHRVPRAAAGFTGYQFDDSVTRLGSATITNLTCAGPMNCHPGWMFGRMTFADKMSFSLTHFEDYFDAPAVSEFLDRLERELFDS